MFRLQNERVAARRKAICLATLLILVGQFAHAGLLRDGLQSRRARRRQWFPVDEEPSARRLSLPAGVRVLRDLAYGNDVHQRLDVHLPARPVKAPILVMVHGGGWRIGDKTNRAVVENKVARWVPRGFIFVSVNYRLLPDAGPPDQAGDIGRALAFVQQRAVSWGGDPARLILMGHSAGAHLVALLSASPAIALSLGARRWLGTVSLDSAALDVPLVMTRRHYPLYDAAFGADEKRWKAVSPIDQLSSRAVPILAICSSIRPDRPCAQTQAFVQKASSLHVHAFVKEVQLSHREINQKLGTQGDYTSAVEEFMGSLDPGIARLLGRPGSR